SDNSTIVSADIDDGSDVLQGTTTAKASGGVATFANLSYDTAETITIVFSNDSLDSEDSDPVLVNPAAGTQLVIGPQPSAIAAAGVAFSEQPVIEIQDQFGNLCTGDNSTVVTASRNPGSGSGSLQGTTSVTANGGIVTFGNLAYNNVGTIGIDFSSG